jgi:Ca-activated chloride channel family protein
MRADRLRFSLFVKRGSDPLILALTALVSLGAQAPTPTIRILSPDADAYLSGPLLLRVSIEPPAAGSRVMRTEFFADGRLVCEILRPPFECEWDSGPTVAEHVVRVVVIFNDGTRLVDTVRTRSLGYVERVDVDVVQVAVVVTDGDGRFVQGLRQEDFRVLEDDRPQPMSHFAAEDIPLELVAALDVSGSMEAAIPSLKVAAKKFFEAIPPQNKVTVTAFNDNIFTLARRTSDLAARARAVDRLASWGGTALYDAIIHGIEVVGRQPGRRALVVFTDGEDQSSHATIDAAIRRVESTDTTVYMIGQGRATKHAGLQKLMLQLSTVSGGRAFFTDDADRLEAAFHEIVEDLSHQYLVSYVPPPGRMGAWRRIRIEVPGGGRRVRARQGYRLVRHN